MRYVLIAFVMILGLAALYFEGSFIYRHVFLYYPETVEEENNESEEPINEEEEVEEIVLPDSVDLEVPFIAQAPGGDWSYPFPYTCEEAAGLMVYYFFEERRPISDDTVKAELRDIVAFEDENYGYHEDTSISQTAKFIEDYFGYNLKVTYDISHDDIKRELFKGNPVIVPTAGRLLENPHFKPPGPVYHVILIKGYNREGFISHDPGTAHGEDVLYSYEIMEEAVHDLVDGDITEGRTAMISFQ